MALGSDFIGPIYLGTRPQTSPTTPAINDFEPVQCAARITLAANAANAVTNVLYIPIGSIIQDITLDTVTAWNGTAAPLSIGVSAGDATYAGPTAIAALGRARPAFTGPQLAAMGNVVGPAALYITVAPTGANTTGLTYVTVEYTPISTNAGST
jgi:hypothetical protein